MSIFEAKEWWSTVISNKEEFDTNSISVDNIDNENPPKNKIIIGSFSGFLRIYEPHFGNFKSDDMLYEKFYENPILQVSTGNFIINSPDKQLAILQNKKLIVLQIFNLRNITQIKNCYEHKLNRNAFNFCLGRIGDRNYDIIFVQSVDGAISIYEQDSLVNMIALSEVIIPGPINFLTRKECLLISNTNYEIECYSYNNLATTTASRAVSSNESSSDKKVINHTWSTELGELIREVKVIDNKVSKKQEIMVLTETHIFLLDDNGKLIYQKKLDYEPMSLHVYNIDQSYLNMSNNYNNNLNLNGTGNNQAQNSLNAYSINKSINLMYMISTVMEHIFVYRGLELVWAVKLPETAVSIFLSDFDVNKNLITTLTDNGRLSVYYLGMEQYKSSKIISGNRNLDPAFMASETERLGELIQNYEDGIQVLSSSSVNISADVFSKIFFDNSTLNEKIFYTDSYGKIARAQVCLTFSFDGFLAEKIKVNLITPNNVICDRANFTIENISKAEGDKKIYVNFRVLNILFPSFTNVKVHATYTIKSNYFFKEIYLYSINFLIVFIN